MPSEFRFLVFSPGELQKALVAFALRAQKKMPFGSVEGVQILEEEAPSAVLTITPDSGASVQVPFTPEETLASLVGICLDRKIPLPREHAKALEIFQGRLALRIMMSEIGSIN